MPNTAIVRDVLPNGLRLLTERMPHVRSVSIGVWLARGSRHEPAAQSGIAHFGGHGVRLPPFAKDEWFVVAILPLSPIAASVGGQGWCLGGAPDHHTRVLAMIPVPNETAGRDLLDAM